jgi:hypothetical protein
MINDLQFYVGAGILAGIYLIGEATGYLFVALFIILPPWAWLLGLLDSNNQNYLSKPAKI